MLPFSIAFMIAWGLMFAVWIFFGWPLGPGAPLLYDAGAIGVR
ncbi:MAG: AbgT family transporter [Gemmatimonadales bacterium]